MSTNTATIIKVGNSYGIRLPKSYMQQQHLRPGDQVLLPQPLKPSGKTALAALRKVASAKQKGALAAIKDPVAWQKKVRSEWDSRERQ